MDEIFVSKVSKFASQLVGKTISLPIDYENRKLANESRENARKHEWLYHCTNTAGLLGMLHSKEFWLTNLQKVNDREEADRIDVPSYEKSYYVGCFTYDPNILDSHWIEYGSLENGVLIGFKRNWFYRKPVFLTGSCQKCNDALMRIFNNGREAMDFKIAMELDGCRGIDPYHIFDFDFYQIIYDDNLKKTILGDCTIDWNGTAIPGNSLSQSIPGIIKSRAGWCERGSNEKYWKEWESEKEVRLKVGVHRLSHNEAVNTPKSGETYFPRLVVPLTDDAFSEIRITFSPKHRDAEKILREIQILYPNSVIITI